MSTARRSETLSVAVSRLPDAGLAASIRDHVVMLDELPKYGGHDVGANPVEHMLAGLAAASLVVVNMMSGGDAPEVLRLAIEAELNVERVLGDDEGQPFHRIDLEWKVAGPKDAAELEALLPELARRRPGQALIDAAATSVERAIWD